MAGFYENISNTTVQEAAEADALASKNAASVSEANAATSAANAATSEANAATSATNAASSETSVSADASAVSASAVSALASKNAAETAKTNAETAETNAETAETNAATSATSAATSASTATTKASEASTSASNTATSETNAASSATSASTSASTATTKASEASTSASNASTSETNAASSASSASASETSALASKNAASTSESNAATSATNASTSATNSASSATASSNSASSATTAQSAAEAARDAALAAFDSFDDRYLGQRASNPSTDNDGNALVAGTLVFNTTTDEMKVYDGSAWLNAYASLSGALLATSNLSDLNNAGTARTNLGLGSAATTDASAYATAAQADQTVALTGAGATSISGIYPNFTITSTDTNTTYSVGDGGLTQNNFTDADHSKLNAIEASADVTDTANVTAAGALMDSELTSEASVKALNQGVATGDSPTFAGVTLATADINAGTIDGTAIGASSASTGAFTTLTASGAFTSRGIDDNATSTALTIDGSGNTIFTKSGGAYLQLKDASAVRGAINVTTSDGLVFTTGSSFTERMRIDGSSGNVGIGTSAIMQDFGGGRTTLALKGAGSTDYSTLQLGNYGTSSNGQIHGLINFYDGTTSVSRIQSVRASNTSDANLVFYTAPSSGGITERMRINSSGSVDISGCASGTEQFRVGNSSGGTDFGITVTENSGVVLNAAEGGTARNMQFATGGTERARLDSSGNLLVGKTASGTANTGAELRNGSSNHAVIATSTSETPVVVNRKTNDGSLIYFYKDGSTVGSIGASGGDLVIGTGDTGIHFHDGVDSIMPWNVSTVNYRDAAIDLGTSTYRFKDLYLSGNAYLGDGKDLSWGGTYNNGNPTIAASSNFIAFYPEGTTSGEAARIDASGATLINTTFKSNGGTRLGVFADSGSVAIETRCKTNVSYYAIANYSSSGTYIGGINVSTTATNLATTSDQRLKENIADADDAGSKIDAIQVRKYDWKADGSHQDYGMVAQELREIIPNVIHESPDEEKMLSVDYAGLVPMLIKEIQSLRNRIAALEE